MLHVVNVILDNEPQRYIAGTDAAPVFHPRFGYPFDQMGEQRIVPVPELGDVLPGEILVWLSAGGISRGSPLRRVIGG